MRGAVFSVVALFAAASGGLAFGAPPDDLSPRKSRFTTINLNTCAKVKSHPDGDTHRCEGFAGLPIYFAEGDLRVFMSFGKTPGQRRAATQTLKAFNAVFEPGRRRATIEWRTERRGGREHVYAAIVRYFTQTDDRKGQVLVVTRITDTEACHLAYVDALANAQPVALARSAADELARGFDCRSEPRVVGVTGKSPM